MRFVSAFHCTPQVVATTPGLGEHLRLYGINCLEMPVWLNPAGHPDFGAWVASYEPMIADWTRWCQRAGWYYVGRADDMLRTEPEQDALFKFDGDALRHAAKTHRNGNCIGIEVCDEMRQDPDSYRVIPELERIWYTEGGPNLAYPGYAPQRYEKFSRASSRQFNWTTAVSKRLLLDRLRGSLEDAPKDGRSITALIPLVGKCYYKRVPGDHWQDGDRIIHPGVADEWIDTMIEMAGSVGANRLRLYALDTFWRKQRADLPIGGNTLLQTGFTHWDPRFSTIGHAVTRFLNWA